MLCRGVAVLSACVVAAVAGGSLAVAPTARAADPDPYGTLYDILPPGQDGTVSLVDLVGLATTGGTTATPTNPPHFADQLELYDKLTTHDPASLTDADVASLYKRENFTPDQVVSTATPTTGVTIQRDQYGVPYITGDTYDDVEFGAGYAAVQDRMFLMDVLRHTGEGRMAEFVGNTAANVAMDQEQISTAFYTPAEAEAQVQAAAARAGADGPKFLAAVDAFVAGINQAQHDLCPTVLATTCPAEYAALQKTPQDWTPGDIVYIASLVGGIFGKGGGQEAANAQWYQALKAKFGRARAKQVYTDLREKNDPEAPTTSTRRTPYEDAPFSPGLPGVALPDRHGPTAPGSGSLIAGSSTPPSTSSGGGGSGGTITIPGIGTVTLPGLDLSGLTGALQRSGMSNAVLVDRKHSATGHPIAVFGPQTGYYTPQLLTEEVLKGPGIMARGVAFAGTNLFVQLGRGLDYSWSATSAGSDNVDVVVERLCNTDGTQPTVQSTGYRVGGRCVPMQQDVQTETTTPNLTAPAPSATYRFLVLRTRHGLVQQRTTVKGKPVALVLQRTTYNHEVDSVIGFGQLNDPGYVTGARGFEKAASHIDYTFNWFYADSRDIAYYSSGLLPVRSPRVEPDLPHWAGKRYDWRGFLPFRKHAKQIDPGRGYFVSWNNKEAPGFGAADDTWSYGPVYRSLALEDRLKRQIKGKRKVTVPGVVGVMSGAATADSRAFYTLKWLLKVIGKDPKTKAARTLLAGWEHRGAPRVDRDRNGSYDDQAAVDLFDTWWQSGSHSVAYDVMRGGLGRTLVHQLPQALDDHPRLGRGSAWNGIAWYGYVNKELRTVLGKRVEGAYSRPYCGNGTLKSCRRVLRRSLAGAVKRALAAEHVGSVDQLTYDKTQDDIRSVTAGIASVRPIDWQNRPTFQQVVDFFAHR